LLTDPQIPIVIKEDNQGAIALAQNPIAHFTRTKHIDIHFHFIREAQEEGIVYCPISEMVADLLTKTIPRGQFEKL